MKTLMKNFVVPVIAIVAFASCSDEKNQDNSPGSGDGGAGGARQNSSEQEQNNPLAEGAIPKPCTSKVGAVGPPVVDEPDGGMGGMGGGEPLDLTRAIRLVDDFESSSTSTLPETDGRNGYWIDSNWMTPSDANAQAGDLDLTIDSDENDSYMRLVCEGDDACNTDWSKDEPYQWAGATAFFVQDEGVACYDAKVYLGIKFRARSASAGQKLRVQFSTPGDHRENRDTFTSKEIVLSKQWITRTIWFREALLQGGERVDSSELESVSFVVQNLEILPEGQRLLPYDIHIDDVFFVTK